MEGREVGIGWGKRGSDRWGRGVGVAGGKRGGDRGEER